MTRLTAEFKKGKRMCKMLRLKKQHHLSAHQHTYTNFSGCYPGKGGLTKEQLEEDFKYAEAVRRQKFW